MGYVTLLLGKKLDRCRRSVFELKGKPTKLVDHAHGQPVEIFRVKGSRLDVKRATTYRVVRPWSAWSFKIAMLTRNHNFSKDPRLRLIRCFHRNPNSEVVI